MAGSKGDSIKLLPFFLCASVSAAAGGTKTTRYAGERQELYKRNRLSCNMEVLKLL